MSHRIRLLLVYALPPLVVGVILVVLYVFTNDVRSGGPVQILDAGMVVGTGTDLEALDYVATKTGMKPVLPTVLPQGGYDLTAVNAVPAKAPATGYLGVNFTYDRHAGAPAWFWVNQFGPGLQSVPDGLEEVNTAVEGARIWTLGEPSEDAPETERRFQFIAKTAKYDRIISFEGAYRPDMTRARLVIESMLRQD